MIQEIEEWLKEPGFIRKVEFSYPDYINRFCCCMESKSTEKHNPLVAFKVGVGSSIEAAYAAAKAPMLEKANKETA